MQLSFCHPTSLQSGVEAACGEGVWTGRLMRTSSAVSISPG